MIATQRDTDWLAGLLEGEGTFCMTGEVQNPVVGLRMTDEDIVARASRILDCTYSEYQPKAINTKLCYVIYLSGARAIAAMQELLPLMGERRQEQIQSVLANCNRTTPRPTSQLRGGGRTTITRKDREQL